MRVAAAAGAAPLCRLDDIPDGGAKGFTVPGIGEAGELFVVRRGERVFAYVNSCPHVGTPLEFVADQFLNLDRTLIQCSTHGALFRIEDGYCVDGPCSGDALEALEAEVRDGQVYLRG
jgi:nitrite reductase/ring-hydroxylating ferredoxin subunit